MVWSRMVWSAGFGSSGFRLGQRTGRRLAGMQIEGSASDQDMHGQAEQTDRFVLADLGHRGEGEPVGIDYGDRAAAFDFQGVVRADEGSGVLVQTDADGERVVG